MRLFSIFVSVVSLWSLSLSRAQALPSDLELTPLLSGLSWPTAVRHAGDGSNRIFIVQLLGVIRVAQVEQDGTVSLLPENFLVQPVTMGGESGLLGLAFHPDFANNGFFYVAFTAPDWERRRGTAPDQVIARFKVSNDDPNRADPDSRLDIIRIADLSNSHNGGDLHFGPDGYLYYSSGDGGPLNDAHGFALCDWKKPADSTISNCSPGPDINYALLGKILRLDVDNPTPSANAEMCGSIEGRPANYSIPSDNPNVDATESCDEIWHTGLRNPWRFSFDRATGDMFIGDVGDFQREEINLSAPGQTLHFGWGCMEGLRVNKTAAPCINDPVNSLPDAALPIMDYARNEGGSVTGGFVYRGPVARLQGSYWFGDFVSGRVWYAQQADDATWSKTQFATFTSVIGFGEDEAGNLYLTNFNGEVRRLSSEAIFDHDFE